MIEDQLSHDERVRLECLVRAIDVNARRPEIETERILTDAKAFEQFVLWRAPRSHST